MLEVHPPHSSGHGWRDFVFHLLTITAGLFIALTLESGVQWLHHRHLAHEAEASLLAEVRGNAKSLEDAAKTLRKHQENLKADVTLINAYLKTGKLPKGSSLEVNFSVSGLDNLSWTTAQSTGALAYMSYGSAQEYAQIYTFQSALDSAQMQAARDAILCIGPFTDMDQNVGPTKEEAAALKEHIQVLQGQLVMVNSLLGALDDAYKKFLAAHPN